jgi:type I restriction-modification system DNA methylase subunit
MAQLEHIEAIEKRLWSAADTLRANSSYASNEFSNGNYVWISYFYSYLNVQGRAGFVMSSQASSAGRDEAKVRQKLMETGDVDVMVAIRSNFFYTRTVPCELWFLKRAKPEVHRDIKLVGRTEIEANDWSLTPGRYVGIAPEEEDENFDFEEALRDIHVELEDLNAEAVQLAATIKKNFEELGV